MYFTLRLKLKNLPHHCEDNALGLYSASLLLKRMRFSTKNLSSPEAGLYLTVVQMVWLIAEIRQDSFRSHVVIGRGDHPDT